MSLTVQDNWQEVRKKRREQVVETLAQNLSRENPNLFHGKSLSGVDYETAISLVRNAVLSDADLPVMDREEVIRKIMGQVSGYGPLQQFFLGKVITSFGEINAMEITEVMVNPSADGRPKVFFGWHGRPHYAGDGYFADNREVTNYVQKTCEDAGRFFGEDVPVIDAWLQDGSRLAAFGFRANPVGTAFTIRKSPLVRPALPLSALMGNGMFPPLVMNMIVDLAVKGHANFGVFGRTDSGKSTVVRAAGETFDPMERVIIGEMSYELAFPHLLNCLNLVAVGTNDKKIVTMNDICDAMNRNNPDRSIVGEIRGGEIVGASEIAESTSGGFITTGHAGGVNELRSRMPKMFARGGMELKNDYVDTQINTMFHFLLFFDKPWDNIRTLLSLVEVKENGEYETIVRFDEDEFAASNGETRRWIYEKPISNRRLSRLAFRGGVILPEYTGVKDKYLYCPGKEV